MQVYTIGYGRKTFADLLPLLRSNGINSLVDVRSVPYSKFAPEFCKNSLKALCTSQGIKYHFIADVKGTNLLGGMPEDPSVQYEGRVDYDLLREKEYFKEGIKRLLELSEKNNVCLLCAEEDPMKCHRQHLITKTLTSRGVKVLHIRAKGELEEAGVDKKQTTLAGFF